MNNIYIMFDNFHHGYFLITLNLLCFISIIFAVLVIITKNPIISVLFLIGLFLSIASYLIAIGLTFIGISYLLVYVGAVSILFLFILMLINIRVSELTTETKNSLPLIIIVTIVFENIYKIAFSKDDFLHDSIINNDNYLFSNITYYSWENNLTEFTHITSIGDVMYGDYSILLILASIILLLAMVGAIVITIKQKPIIKEEKTL